MRIGEFLVQQDLVTKDQLKQALEAQLIFGGHLGTCLMERGAITERQLGKVLAEMLGVGYASPDCFEKIRRQVIDAVPEKLVEKHRVVPFRLQDRTLDLAMVDPQDLRATDGLAFATGYKIRPWVAPESRVLQAMERYYGIRRGLRYVTLCRDTDQQSPNAGPLDVPISREIGARPQPRTAGRVVAPALAASASASASASTATATAVAEAPAEPDALSSFSSALLSAETVDQVAELVVSHGSRTLERCVVMMVRLDTALPWQGRGWQCEPSKWSQLSFTVTSEPVFSLLNGENLYRGPVPRQAEYLRFFSTLGLDVPEEAILLPAHVDDRLVALFYGDGGPHEKILGEDNYYRRLARKFGLALSLVESRRKLISA